MPVDSYSTFFLVRPSSLRLALCVSTSSSSSSPILPVCCSVRHLPPLSRLSRARSGSDPRPRRPTTAKPSFWRSRKPWDRDSATATICCFREGMLRVIEVTCPLDLERHFTSIWEMYEDVNACFYCNVSHKRDLCLSISDTKVTKDALSTQTAVRCKKQRRISVPGDPRYTDRNDRATMQRPFSNCPSSSFDRVFLFPSSYGLAERKGATGDEEVARWTHIDTVSRARGERRRKVPHRQEAEEIRTEESSGRRKTGRREEKVNGEVMTRRRRNRLNFLWYSLEGAPSWLPSVERRRVHVERKKRDRQKRRGWGVVLMKMYRGRKSRAEWPLRVHLASVVGAKYGPSPLSTLLYRSW